MNADLINSKGLKITKIDCSQVDFVIERFSELGDNWSIPSECPTCKRYLEFTKKNVNKLITCKCGQKIKLVVPKELL